MELTFYIRINPIEVSQERFNQIETAAKKAGFLIGGLAACISFSTLFRFLNCFNKCEKFEYSPRQLTVLTVEGITIYYISHASAALVEEKMRCFITRFFHAAT